ncbi:hypothetical protein BGX34_002758 [Mortierella sp. NVP85]|nr:hypothetical protein BGX34_002758 [Mortierella sp. NVP85]
MVKIWCLVNGRSSSQAFSVDADASATIIDLKNFIKAQYPDDFKGVGATSLTLWHVKVPTAQGQITLSLPNEESILNPLNLNKVQEDAIGHYRLNELIPLSRLNLSDVQMAVITRCWLKEDKVIDVKFLDSPRASLSSVLPSVLADDEYILIQLPQSVTPVPGKRVKSISFERITVRGSETDFWTTFGDALRANYGRLEAIESMGDFLSVFTSTVWEKRRRVKKSDQVRESDEGEKSDKGEKKVEKIVIIIDEFDLLFDASETVRDECLSAIRTIRQLNNQYAIDSVIACGTFSLRHLTTSDNRVSPFNANAMISNPYFTLIQTRQLFSDYESGESITIDERIVEEIFHNSSGHPGMVCLCGMAIHNNLRSRVNRTNNRLDYRAWNEFSTSTLHRHIHGYNTFRRMVDTLLEDSASEAVDLLRMTFIGHLSTVSVPDTEEQKVDFLVAEGVLSKNEHGYCMASAYIDSFIRNYVILAKYPTCPSIPGPKQYEYGPLDILSTLKVAVQHFDKELLQQAPNRSYKSSGGIMVDGRRGARVPRESVYDTELARILTNWLGRSEAFQITGQWHLREVESHRYTDIVIQKEGDPTVVLELVATTDQASLREHIERASSYKSLLPAEVAWVIHFTCQDDYLQDPLWPSTEQLQDVNIVHFWHDRAFDNIRMSARWIDEEGSHETVDEIVNA